MSGWDKQTQDMTIQSGPEQTPSDASCSDCIQSSEAYQSCRINQCHAITVAAL
ncbi:Hypothetical protein P9303_25701 [Prochlorococcus marinus str. MIT 9303]|uniref:Uncharacterized protein n=1 Tax=Prochlorococcus marinus (strain MIT 9303) TaxID=59922 RepID=A2CCU1_PROM3|nr:Hypothetical protein P9303_25701 [Prochlorococcus marinus str. MIT 9303]